MATTPRERLERERRKIEGLADKGTLSAESRDRLLRFGETLDKAVTRHQMTGPKGEVVALEPRSVEVYLRCLRLATQEGLDLLDTSADAFNALMDGLHEGGRTKSTLNTYQSAARRFYQCFPDLGVAAEDITTFSPDKTPRHDEADMFSEDEVWALRNACGRTKIPVRNRAFLELLIFTGQRVRALCTLRIGDIDVDAGYLYLNDEVDGLKGALRRGRKRPMFGARKYVKQWIQAHPNDDPDEWLFIGDPSHWRTDPDDHWAETSADQTLRRIGDYADVDKPVNPHNFRHYCATVLRRDFKLDWEEINALFGVVQGSEMPRRTYAHIDDDTLRRSAEEAMGYREPEDEPSFTPPVCPVCDGVLRREWQQCPDCGELFGPVDAVDRVRSRIGADEGLLEELREAGEADLASALADVMDEGGVAPGERRQARSTTD